MTSPTSARESLRTAESGVSPYAVALVAWLVPGAAHLWLGQPRKAVIFFVMLTGMFAVGLAFGGRVFPFQIGDPLVFLAAAAEWGQAVPRVVAAVAGVGQGDVVAATYEYGNTFLMVSGLLNMLVVLNAVDAAVGRGSR